MEFRLLTVTQLTETLRMIIMEIHGQHTATLRMDQMVHHIVLMEIQLMTMMATHGQHTATLRMDQTAQLCLRMETLTITVMVLPVRPMEIHTIVINNFKIFLISCGCKV